METPRDLFTHIPTWQSAAPTTRPLAFVVGDDEYGRHSLEELITPAGLDVESCGSAGKLLPMSRPTVPCCLVLLDV